MHHVSRRQDSATDYRPELVRCADSAAARFGLQHGLAGYWAAKQIQTLSAHTLRLNQIGADLDSHYWMTNLHWLLQQDAPPYSFVVLDISSQSTASNTFGRPTVAIDCGRTEIWIYQGKEAAHFQRVGREIDERVAIWQRFAGR